MKVKDSKSQDVESISVHKPIVNPAKPYLSFLCDAHFVYSRLPAVNHPAIMPNIASTKIITYIIILKGGGKNISQCMQIAKRLVKNAAIPIVDGFFRCATCFGILINCGAGIGIEGDGGRGGVKGSEGTYG
jgi:hypothetical protein